MQQSCDSIWVNAHIATCDKNNTIIPRGAIAIQDKKISWIGSMTDLPASFSAEIIYDASGYLITPGLIDCHTHLVFGGNRAHEFEMRLNGVKYEEIARQGGGIQSTVTSTRELSEEELLQQSLVRANCLMKNGVTTLEIKSGYGLDLENEIKILRVAKKIGETLPLTIYKTFLGAHTVPKEFLNRADDYIDYVCNVMIPKIAAENLADAVDVFCERIAFNLQQTEKVFQTAKKYQLAIKCHAEQLSNSKSAELAARYHALSVDHLEYISEEGVKALAESGTIAVLLPGAFYFLREKQLPPIALLRKYHVPIALGTDCNPGTSPMLSLLLALNMGCTLLQLTTQETLHAVTRIAAKALNFKDRGVLLVNNVADLAIWDVQSSAELSYYFGGNPLKYLIKNGEIVLDGSSV